MREKKRMTPEEAEHILLNITDYIVPDEDYGFLMRAPLVDATILAIKALRAMSENNDGRSKYETQ